MRLPTLAPSAPRHVMENTILQCSQSAATEKCLIPLKAGQAWRDQYRTPRFLHGAPKMAKFCSTDGVRISPGRACHIHPGALAADGTIVD